MAQIECEQMLSRKEPGGLFAICSQGNFPLWGNFRASAGSTARDAAQKRGFARGSILEARERQASSAPSLREPAHHSANADDETEGVALFLQVRFR